MNKKVKKLTIVIIACLIILPTVIFAQGGFDDDVLDNPVPFDGGVSLLIAAGLGYGIKKVREQRRAEQK
jgi:hypothetical protein